MLFKKKTDDAGNWLKNNSPALTFWVASIALIFFEMRVLDVVYSLTKSYLLTVSSLFATGFMFFIWKTAFQYTLANSHQVKMASAGMVIALLASAVFGGMDFFVKGGLVVDTGTDKFGAVDLLFWGIPVLSVIHVVLLLLYWYLDPVTSAERKKKVADDDAEFAKQEMLHADSLLKTRTELIDNFVTMARKFGREAALNQLEALGIDRGPFLDVVVKPPSGHGQEDNTSADTAMTDKTHAMTEPKPSMTTPLPAMTDASLQDVMSMTPLSVTVRSNGNGKNVDPT